MKQQTHLLLFPLLAILLLASISGCGQDPRKPYQITGKPEGRDIDDHPTWLADGRILFTRMSMFPSSIDGLFTINPDGSDLRHITGTSGHDSCASQSPDGKELAFGISEMGGGIYLMNMDGSNRRQVKSIAPGADCPRWSPDGHRIAFTAGDFGSKQLYIMNRDGANLTQLTDLPFDVSQPEWEPSGQRLAFIDNTSGNIHLVPAQGGIPMQVTTVGKLGWHGIAWSRDGKWLVYSGGDTNAENSSGIYVIHPDGTWRRQVVKFSYGIDSISLSPNSKLLSFALQTATQGSPRGYIYVENIEDLLD